MKFENISLKKMLYIFCFISIMTMVFLGAINFLTIREHNQSLSKVYKEHSLIYDDLIQLQQRTGRLVDMLNGYLLGLTSWQSINYELEKTTSYFKKIPLKSKKILSFLNRLERDSYQDINRQLEELEKKVKQDIPEAERKLIFLSFIKKSLAKIRLDFLAPIEQELQRHRKAQKDYFNVSMTAGQPFAVLSLTTLLVSLLIYIVFSLWATKLINQSSIEQIKNETQRTKLLSELEAAESIQENLLGVKAEIPQLEIASYYKAAERAGGDWFGYYYDESSRLAFLCCGDVTGHGISAALLTGVATGVVESFMNHFFSISKNGGSYTVPELITEVLTHANAALHSTASIQGKAMTLSVMGLCLETGKLWVASAGHNPPFLTSSKGTRKLSISGNRLGIFPHITSWKIREAQLSPGDIIISYTDGLIENRGPKDEVISESFIKHTLNNCCTKNLRFILDTLLEEGKNCWQDRPQEDDCTIALYRWLGPISKVNRKKTVEEV